MYGLIILSLIGIVISFYLYNSKKKHRKIVCVIGKDCNKVIKSRYSRTLGVQNEILGILYYMIVILSLVLVNMGFPLGVFLIVVSIVAFLFSLMLTCIQLFILREFCEYCLAVFLINLIIMLVIIFWRKLYILKNLRQLPDKVRNYFKR